MQRYLLLKKSETELELMFDYMNKSSVWLFWILKRNDA